MQSRLLVICTVYQRTVRSTWPVFLRNSVQVQNNIEANKETVAARTNLKSHPMNLNLGDFVYPSIPAVGTAYKLQAKFSGPYVVHTVCSDSRVKI